MKGEPYTPEQIRWIKENVSCGVFKDKKHFLAVFNVIFNENRTIDAMTQYLHHNGLVLITRYNAQKYTEEQDLWLKTNYSKYNVLADFVRDYNSHFSVNVGYTNLISHCKTLGLHSYDNARRKNNAGQFRKGQKYGSEEAPVGTIAYNKQRDLCFIKVQMCDGKSRMTAGHNHKEPYWKPLQNKVWEDNNGVIPNGYIACSLTDDPYEQNIKNIALIDKRGKAIMSRKDWWSDNPKFTAVAVRWCNLYFIAKDRAVL